MSSKSFIVKFALVPLSLVCVTFVGCSPYDASVSGEVTLDGEPLERGTIAFHPMAEGPTCFGAVESDGSYFIRTGREEGLSSGEYGVTVVANAPPSMERTESGGPPPPGKAITPPWYRSLSSSPLVVMVEPGSNEIDLELSSDPPPGYEPPGGRRRGR